MLEKLITVLFSLGLVGMYLAIAFIAAVVIQLISYRVFNFNLYKFLKYHLIDKQL